MSETAVLQLGSRGVGGPVLKVQHQSHCLKASLSWQVQQPPQVCAEQRPFRTAGMEGGGVRHEATRHRKVAATDCGHQQFFQLALFLFNILVYNTSACVSTSWGITRGCTP